VRVLCNYRLIPFILYPGNVAGMMILNQYLPLLAWLVMPRTFARVTIGDANSGLGFPECVSACIHRIRKDAANVDMEVSRPGRAAPPGMSRMSHYPPAARSTWRASQIRIDLAGGEQLPQ